MSKEIDKIRKEIQELSKEYANMSKASLAVSEEDFKKAMDKIAASLDDPKERHAMAGLITEQVFDTIRLEDLTAIIPNRVYAPNETPVFFKRGRLRVYYLEHGATALKTQQTRTEFTVTTRPLVGAPSYNYDQLKTGRYGDFAEQTRLINEEFAAAKNKLIFDTLTAAVTSANTYGGYFTQAGRLSKSTLDRAIDYVMGVSNNRVKAVIGLHKHMAGIIDFQDRSSYGIELWTEEQKRQFMQVGMIDMYRGAPIIALNQYIDGHGLITIPDDEILVLTGDDDAYTFLEHGPFDPLEQIDALTRDWVINMMIKIGCYVFKPEKIARIKVSGA